ncbi:hypothetical protein FRB93_002895 [Tulasnella sp. JGI-2019a]|nr:hypothetical protein FRB93_002895 [Tulasnella sp. JGI-2019a]
MHAETRTRRVQRNNGNIETQTYQEWVLDFAFAINLTLSIIPEPLGVPIYLVGDRTPAYRGKTVMEVDEGEGNGESLERLTRWPSGLTWRTPYPGRPWRRTIRVCLQRYHHLAPFASHQKEFCVWRACKKPDGLGSGSRQSRLLYETAVKMSPQ